MLPYNNSITHPTRESDPETPQPKHSRYQLQSTRPRIPQPDFGLSMASSSHTQHSSLASDAGRRGFSLSYLRRVPELSLLASRVVRAVTPKTITRRKEKIERRGDIQV